MSLIKCGGSDVLRGRVHMPDRGAWWAELALDTDEAPSGSVTIEAADGLAITGTVQRAGVFMGAAHVQLVGGAGGLGNDVEPRAFQNALLRDVLEPITAASGDTLSSQVSADLLGTLLAAWVQTKKQAAIALDDVCGFLSAARGEAINWRYLADGTLWLGAESWPSAKLPTDDEVLELEPTCGRYVIGAATPSLLPGVELDTVGRVTAVDHWFEPDETRTWAWVGGGVTAKFGGLVRSIVGLPKVPGAAPVIDRLALYRATVKAASDDGKTLDVKPEDERLSGLQRVPMRVAVAGETLVVQPGPGAVVLLGWERGDPSRPYCVPAWEQDSVTVQKLVFKALQVYLADEGGAQKLALAPPTQQSLDALFTLLDSIFGAASAPIVTPAPSAPDPVYVAMKAAIGLLTSANNWPAQQVAADKVSGV